MMVKFQVAKHVVSDIVTSPNYTTLDPNNILENFIEQIKSSLKERLVSLCETSKTGKSFVSSDSHQLDLSDMKVSGVILFDGRLSGLTNMTRWGNATLEMKYEAV